MHQYNGPWKFTNRVSLHVTEEASPIIHFVINVTGAFVIGLLIALTARKLISPSVQIVLADP